VFNGTLIQISHFVPACEERKTAEVLRTSYINILYIYYYIIYIIIIILYIYINTLLFILPKLEVLFHTKTVSAWKTKIIWLQLNSHTRHTEQWPRVWTWSTSWKSKMKQQRQIKKGSIRNKNDVSTLDQFSRLMSGCTNVDISVRLSGSSRTRVTRQPTRCNATQHKYDLSKS